MLPDSVRSLILDEQARQASRFVEGVEIHGYLDKLAAKAEILSDCAGGRCRGVVAYYCNDVATKQAYISLVLVDPRDRGSGIGSALVLCVLDLARRRGFTSCRLEVARRNAAAYAMYRSLGFRLAEARGDKELLEVDL
jgi:ribosomal protein S18 acetylase RimI-like enzyme